MLHNRTDLLLLSPALVMHFCVGWGQGATATRTHHEQGKIRNPKLEILNQSEPELFGNFRFVF